MVPERRSVETTDLADELVECVTRIRRVLDSRLQVHGVSVARTRVLGALADGPARQAVLAETLELAPRTITEAVDALERDGLVRRAADPDDRRAWLVHLTAAGRRTYQAALTTRRQAVDQVFADLTSEQQAALSTQLHRLRERAAAMTVPSPTHPHRTV